MGIWATLTGRSAAPRADNGAWPSFSGGIGGGNTPDLEAAAAGRRLRNFRPTTSHINALTARAGPTVTARARWFCRNNAYGINAVDWWSNTVIGSGISPSWNLESANLKKKMREAWDDWTDEADAEGLTDFYGIQRRACREVFIAGEVFIRLRYRRPEDGLTVPLQLQMLPSEMLDPNDTRVLAGGNVVKQGIEFDLIGRRVAYWFYRVHPSDAGSLAGMKTRVPAAEVVHILDPVEAGQIRGLSRFSNVTAALFTLDAYDDAELERKKTAALFAGFIKRAAVDDTDLPVAGETEGVNAGGSLVGGQYDDTALVAGLEAGTMQVLNPGEDVSFSEPADVGGSYENFQYRTLLRIAAGLGVPYFALTGDLARTSYSSARVQQVDTKKRVDAYQWSVVIFGMCRPVVTAWLTQAALSGAVVGFSAEAYARRPKVYQRIRWMTPPWLWVDPLKDMQADKMAVDNGFKARSDVIEANGFDAAETDRRIAADRKREQELGLAFPQPKDGAPPPADPPADGEDPPAPGSKPAPPGAPE